MLDTLLIIILQSWGLWLPPPPAPGGAAGRDGPGEDGEERLTMRLTDEEAAEILRVLNTFSGRVETPVQQD